MSEEARWLIQTEKRMKIRYLQAKRPQLHSSSLNVSSSRVYLTLELPEIRMRRGRVYAVLSIVSRDASVRSVLLSAGAPRRLRLAVPIGKEWRTNAGDTAGQYAGANHDSWPGDERHACRHVNSSSADELPHDRNSARCRHALTCRGKPCKFCVCLSKLQFLSIPGSVPAGCDQLSEAV